VYDEEGEVMKKQVYDKLVEEKNQRRWDPEDPLFADELLVCCPRPEIFWGGYDTLLTGHWVIEGIRAFLSDIALALEQQCEKFLDVAKNLTGCKAYRPQTMLDCIETKKDHLDNETIQTARQQARRALQLSEQAKKIRDKSEFLPNKCHGFIVSQKAGKGEVVLRSLYQVNDDVYRRADLPPTAFRDWQPCKLVVKTGAKRWLICSDEDQDYLLGYALASMEHRSAGGASSNDQGPIAAVGAPRLASRARLSFNTPRSRDRSHNSHRAHSAQRWGAWCKRRAAEGGESVVQDDRFEIDEYDSETQQVVRGRNLHQQYLRTTEGSWQRVGDSDEEQRLSHMVIPQQRGADPGRGDGGSSEERSPSPWRTSSAGQQAQKDVQRRMPVEQHSNKTSSKGSKKDK
jgi:hypothetical protein